ncbi:PDR/VanB family oxidoreductase [Variovorax sp. J22P271]|jgi:vanillate O-demethylase ferredoxin subunit|uniref:PDR/VanB family oxidoreductase n=1 Tax=Variovorax davisae TaxID=3053515 RepID=UPI00257530E6|nr:PDR/VanB family oxidoreductase [Variovorax sp. J22P271]MDM0037223.1 PDR/VanB family oxidoreductase [Variovorax sp. J22P271]
MTNELKVRVARRIEEADGVCSFELLPHDGSALPPFSAGAHIDVHVAPGVIRQYSLSNDPAERHRWRIAVLRESASRGGSAGMHDGVQPGDVLHVSAPRNHFPLVDAPHSLLLAGGIGVTPILAMARALHAQERSFEMHYCGRSAGRMAFLEELAAAEFAGNVVLHADDVPAQKFDAERVLAEPAADTHLYVCGPNGFMNHVLDTARRLGWPDTNLHREYFAGVATALASDGSFEVRVASTGLSCQIPSGKTVIEVLAAHGVEIPTSCEAGVCGTCLTRVLEGKPDHRDSFLTDAERAANDQFTPCCSRALSPLLVLDL